MRYKSRIERTQPIYAKMLDHELLSVYEEQSLLREAQAGDENAREKLILCNMKLVQAVVKQYENHERDITADDLMADGVMGLSKAIDKYDESFGTRLSTYAVLWIHQTTQRSLMIQGTIRLPDHVKRQVNAINKAKATLLADGHKICDAAISEVTEIDVADVERLGHLEREGIHVMSLDVPMDDESTTELLEMIPDEKAQVAYEQVEMEVSLEFFLSKLTARERFIVERSYGIPIQMTNREIAKVIGCNHNYITPIREQAMKKLKRLARAVKGTPDQIRQAIENPRIVMTAEGETIPLFEANEIPNRIEINKKPRKKKRKDTEPDKTNQIPLWA